MRGIHPFPKTDAEERENWRVLGETIEHVYDRWHLTASNGEVAIGGTAVKAETGPAGVAVVPCIQLVDASTGTARWVLPLLPRHDKHTLRLTFRYTSPTGGTANFSIRWVAQAFPLGGAMGAAVTIGDSGAANYAGPTNAYDEKSGVVLLSTAPLSAKSYGYFKLQVSRDGAGDANNNAFDLIYALVEALPA